MRKLYPLLSSLLLTCHVYANNTKNVEQQNITQWHAVYQSTLENNPNSALNLLQNRYHTATYDEEKLYVSGLIFEYMSNRDQPYYGNSQSRNSSFAKLESKYIQALRERKQGRYDASVKTFTALRDEMKQSSNIEGEALMNYQLCFTLNQQGRYHRAHFFCSSLERHLDETQLENFPKDLPLRIIANNYNFRGDNEKSLDVYRRLLESMPQQSDPSGIYNDVGNLLAEIGQFEQAERYLTQALLARQLNATPLKVAQVEHSLAAMHAKAQNFDDSIVHYKNSLTLLEQINYPYGEGLAYLGLASALVETGKVEQAIRYIDAALKLGERAENVHLQTEAHLTAGSVYLEESKPKLAIKYGNNALTLATDNARPLLQAKAQLLLSNAYQSIQDYQSALAHYQAYSTLELSNRDANNLKALEALEQTKSEYEHDLKITRLNNEQKLKQSELERLTAQQNTYSFTVVFLVILLILALMLKRQTRKASRLDTLTCALNRSACITSIKGQRTKAKQNMRHVLALINIDNLTSINNTYGYPVGNLVLKQVCQRLSDTLNRGECLGRLNGNEFVVLLKNIDEIEVPFRIQALHQMISEERVKTDRDEEVTISARLVYLATSNPLTNFDELYTSLEQARKQAESNGQCAIIDAYDEPTYMSLVS